MKYFNQKNREKAQVFLEYAIVLGVVVTVLFAMTVMIRRGTQGMIKVVADEIGVQKNSDQNFDSGSYLLSSYSATRTNLDKATVDYLGFTNYIYADFVIVNTGATVNLGFTEEVAP